jgi:hypothetical protein
MTVTGINKRIFVILLSVLFLSYFAASNMCYHTHIVRSTIYTHSHPFNKAEHDHTKHEFENITILSHYYVENINLFSFIDDIPFLFSERFFSSLINKPVIESYSLSFTIRPPPEYFTL